MPSEESSAVNSSDSSSSSSKTITDDSGSYTSASSSLLKTQEESTKKVTQLLNTVPFFGVQQAPVLPVTKVIQDIKEQDLYSEGEISRVTSDIVPTLDPEYKGVALSRRTQEFMAKNNAAKEEREMRQHDEAFQSTTIFSNLKGHSDGYWQRMMDESLKRSEGQWADRVSDEESEKSIEI